jgi:hypothetical protein
VVSGTAGQAAALLEIIIPAGAANEALELQSNECSFISSSAVSF